VKVLSCKNKQKTEYKCSNGELSLVA